MIQNNSILNNFFPQLGGTLMGEAPGQSLTSRVSGHEQHHNLGNNPDNSTNSRDSVVGAVPTEADSQRWDASLLDSFPASSMTFKRDRRVVRCVQPRVEHGSYSFLLLLR